MIMTLALGGMTGFNVHLTLYVLHLCGCMICYYMYGRLLLLY